MTTRVRVTDDYMLDRVALMVSPSEGRIYRWEVIEAPHEEGSAQIPRGDSGILSLPEGVMRAIYEALGKHFGGGADVAAIRRDYDAERKRVDTFIAHLTKGDA